MVTACRLSERLPCLRFNPFATSGRKGTQFNRVIQIKSFKINR